MVFRACCFRVYNLIDDCVHIFFRAYTNPGQHLAGHFAEKAFHHIQPRAMCGSEHKFKSSRNGIQIFLCLPGCMGGVVVQYKPYFVPFGVFLIQYFKECYKITAFMGIAYRRDGFPGQQVNCCQKGERSQTLILIITLYGGHFFCMGNQRPVL